ncbi:hypothetical protein AAG906_005536 [Vitis piasezkii]
MMFELTFTTGPLSQPSFTEPPHIELPSHQIAWISIRLASPLNISTCSRDLSVLRIVWINNRLHLSISNRGLSALRVVRRVIMRR